MIKRIGMAATVAVIASLGMTPAAHATTTPPTNVLGLLQIQKRTTEPAGLLCITQERSRRVLGTSHGHWSRWHTVYSTRGPCA